MAKRLDRLVYIGINRAMTPSFDRWSKKTYGISGKRLLAKVASAEGGGTTQHPNVSYAGARGPFQFIPSTRNAYKAKYGLDAWRTNTEAAKAAMIHLKGTGIRGYNPGMPSYQNLVLGQNVDTMPLRTGKYGSGKVRRGGGGKQRVVGRAGSVSSSRSAAMPAQADLASLLASMAPPPEPRQSMGLQAPSFAAQPAMPAGYQPPQGVAPAPKQDTLAAQLAAVSALGQVQIPKTTVNVDPGTQRLVGGAGGRSRGVRGGAGGPGKLVGRPIDRPGARTNPEVLRIVKKASGWANLPIKLGTGTAHSRLTVDGNVSNHWGGNAIDLPARGSYGNRVAGALLVNLGVSRKKARQMVRQGGLWNIGYKGRTYQIIWNTQQGGDHTDHVHFGIKR